LTSAERGGKALRLPNLRKEKREGEEGGVRGDFIFAR